MVDIPTRKERYMMHNSLVCLMHAIKDEYVTIEMRNGNAVSGKLSHVDGYMNMAMDDAVLVTADDKQHIFEYFYLQARNIKYVTIPQHFLQIRLGGEQPTCLYIGDNVVQDLYAPAHFTRCDTLAVIEELWAENDIQPPHPEKKVITSNIWGSYFGTSTTPSMWHNFLAKSSQLIVPSFETLAQLPLQGPIPTGYYPELPKSHKQ